MKVLSLDTRVVEGWVFKVSMNNVDGGILIFAHHPIFQYIRIGSFLTPEEGHEWADELVEASINSNREDI
jgi:hypothetical protein